MDDTDQRRIDAGNDIDLKWLRSFVVVAEEASFTRAASRVHVAQPGVSAQVRRLESELGQQLLDRSGRSVRLTEVGSAVLPFARAALDAVANAGWPPTSWPAWYAGKSRWAWSADARCRSWPNSSPDSTTITRAWPSRWSRTTPTAWSGGSGTASSI